ncbi:thermonuclease family protein [Albidovulum sediminis]|uniref:Thermonuclease family protein n=1 Tax=Albidovulum sediminis TaxID=3066345 RepID=A0ABT2NN67_9RHOB|nr:thermonuclease family protein [Defluviimonas sediminis]
MIDGDTIQIGEVRLRLAGIDAPELKHPWGQKAKWELVQLCKGQIITAEIAVDISYDRLVATCYLPDGRDLSAEMVRRGLALDWHNFSGGKYAHLEPEGARKRHWKAAARQRGHMHAFHK